MFTDNLGRHRLLYSNLLLIASIILVTFAVVATQGTQCARAASGSCAVGDSETFTSNIIVNEDGDDADTRFEGDTNANLLYLDAGNDAVLVRAAAPVGSEVFYVNGTSNLAGNVFIADTANTDMTQGVTIQQGANDDAIFALKSSDIGHPFTGIAEADTYMEFGKRWGNGGPQTEFFSGSSGATGGGEQSWWPIAYAAVASTNKTAVGHSPYVFDSAKTDGGTGSTSFGANENIMEVVNNNSTQLWLLDADGDTKQPGAAFFLQSSDPTGISNTAQVYAKDNAGTAEIYVRDEAANVTQISPHQGDVWFFESCNDFTGKCIAIDMEAALAALEQVTGQKFITVTQSTPSLDWDTEQNRLQQADPDYVPEAKPQWLVDRLAEIGN